MKDIVGSSGSAGGVSWFPNVPIPAPWFSVLQDDQYRPSGLATAYTSSLTSQT